MVERMMTQEEIQELVEAHWRTILNLTKIDIGAVVPQILKFEEHIVDISSSLSDEESASFRAAVAQLRGELAYSEKTNPQAVRVKLVLTAVSSDTKNPLIINMETPMSISSIPYLDDFWRNVISLPISQKNNIPDLWNRFTLDMQAKVKDFSQSEQDAFLTRLAVHNALYIQFYQSNPENMKVRLGVQAVDQRNKTDDFAHMVVETATRATIWETIRSLFRTLR